MPYGAGFLSLIGCQFLKRFSYRLVLLALLLGSLLLPLPSQAQTGAGRPLPKRPGWQLTFDDEFSGNTLDTHKWTASEGTFENRSQPIQYFLPSAVTLGGGSLHILSAHRQVHGFDYSSGEIRTRDKFCQLYGRLEVRCRFPQALGSWSAVYLLPADDDWPPEIDAAEFIGRDPHRIYLTNHWRDSGGNHQQINADWPEMQDGGAWHTYTLEWQPSGVSWYIDGVLRGHAGPPVSSVPMYIRINTMVGGDFAGEPQEDAWPQRLDVDYVRMYRRADGPQPVWGPVAHVSSAVSSAGQASLSSPASPNTAEPAAQEAFNPWGLFFLLLTMLVIGWRKRRRTTPHEARTAALAAGVGICAAYYFFFRGQIIHWAAWWIALPLFLAEMHGILHTLGLQYTIWPRPNPGVYADEDAPRRIFLLIPTVNEGPIVLEPTVLGALAARARYLAECPNADVRIVVCNDGMVAGYPEWQDAERLADRLGVDCVTRPVGGGAKAGNIEFARQELGAVGDALLVIFDADQVAEEEFLARTVPYFQDSSLGWVQTGQYYRNLENPVARWANDQQALFYGVLCPGKARLNAAFICGTNVVLRAAALDEIGGLPQDSVTEDFAASLLLHPRWRSLFLTEVLATGLGPMDLKSYFAQQGRWATGTLGALRRHWRALLLPTREGLTRPQKIQYLLACTHYLSGLRDLIYLAVPFLFLLMGVSAIQGTDIPVFLAHFLPYWALSQIAFWHASWRRTTFRGIILSFGSFPVLLASLLLVVLGQRTRFAITPKKRSGTKAGMPLFSQMLALGGCCVGLVMATASQDDKALVLLSAFWLLYMFFMLAGILWLGFRDWRAGRRAAVGIGGEEG